MPNSSVWQILHSAGIGTAPRRTGPAAERPRLQPGKGGITVDTVTCEHSEPCPHLGSQ
jgi:hypothetical protein